MRRKTCVDAGGGPTGSGKFLRSMSDFKPGERKGVRKETCDLMYNGKAICRPELTVTPAMPVLYCAVMKNTARCKFLPANYLRRRSSHGSERKNSNSN